MNLEDWELYEGAIIEMGNCTPSDSHRAKAAEIFKVPHAEVTPEQRKYAKAINFGGMYGPA